MRHGSFRRPRCHGAHINQLPPEAVRDRARLTPRSQLRLHLPRACVLAWSASSPLRGDQRIWSPGVGSTAASTAWMGMRPLHNIPPAPSRRHPRRVSPSRTGAAADPELITCPTRIKGSVLRPHDFPDPGENSSRGACKFRQTFMCKERHWTQEAQIPHPANAPTSLTDVTEGAAGMITLTR